QEEAPCREAPCQVGDPCQAGEAAPFQAAPFQGEAPCRGAGEPSALRAWSADGDRRQEEGARDHPRVAEEHPAQGWVAEGPCGPSRAEGAEVRRRAWSWAGQAVPRPEEAQASSAACPGRGGAAGQAPGGTAKEAHLGSTRWEAVERPGTP